MTNRLNFLKKNEIENLILTSIKFIMENSNINWTTLKQNVINDIYMYYSKIESYKHSFWNNQEKYSSSK